MEYISIPRVLHFEGQRNVDTIEVVDENGRKIISIGTILPGSYPFGKMSSKEVVLKATSGMFKVNNEVLLLTDQEFIVKSGTEVYIKVDTFVASYICFYKS